MSISNPFLGAGLKVFPDERRKPGEVKKYVLSEEELVKYGIPQIKDKNNSKINSGYRINHERLNENRKKAKAAKEAKLNEQTGWYKTGWFY